MDGSLQRAQQHLTDVSNEYKKVGLHINKEKTKFSTYNITDNTTLQVDGENIEKTGNFIYLGSMTQSSSVDIERRRGLAFSVFNQLNVIWNSQVIPLQLQIKIFKVSVIPVFLYGCETWIINEHDKQTINSLATICYRRILHIRQEDEHITNSDVLRMANATDLTTEIHRRQLTKTGHRLRKPVNSISNRFALYEPTHGTRRPGRPKTSFKDSIATIIDPTNKPTETQIRTYAQNRENWTALVEKCTHVRQ